MSEAESFACREARRARCAGEGGRGGGAAAINDAVGEGRSVSSRRFTCRGTGTIRDGGRCWD